MRLPIRPFSKFNNFLWVCWFLCKNLSNFVSWNSITGNAITCKVISNFWKLITHNSGSPVSTSTDRTKYQTGHFLSIQYQNGILNYRSLCSGLKCRKRQKRQTGGQLLLFTKCVTLLYKNPTEIPVTHWIYTFRMQHNGIKLILKSHVKNQNFHAPSLISSKRICI